MSLHDFYEARPFLYHLTDRTNLPSIFASRILLSATEIVNIALPRAEAEEFLRNKRINHVTLTVEQTNYKIRDQKPISMIVLDRSLEGGINAGDFLALLNRRVFWWPNINRLQRHYDRYEAENPIILRVRSEDILSLNLNAEFCHLNSGATRCHPYYNGNAPTRGANTFLPANLYNMTIDSVAEVTFTPSCLLPETVWIGDEPNGDWQIEN